MIWPWPEVLLLPENWLTMEPYDDFFAEFPLVSKEEWLRQVVKDLKGRPLDDLDWELEGDFKVSPFAHSDDFTQLPAPLSGTSNDWEICEEVVATDPVTASRQALEALEGGVNGLRFFFEALPDAAFFDQLFEGIYLDYINLHFTGPAVAQNPGAVLGHLERLAKKRNIPAANLSGSLDYDPAASAGIVDWRYLVDLVYYSKENLPKFKLVNVALNTARPAGAGLAEGLKRGNVYLQKLAERGLAITEAAGAIQFSFAIRTSYFLEMARIRAFRLLWLNVLNAWNAPLRYPATDVRFHPDAYTGELYSNMIRATTMAMSAVLGGADRLTVLPYDAGRESQATYPPAFSRRMARNVQHLLKMEGFFSEIPEPAAGSYYIERLTQQVAERAWQSFQAS